MSNDSKHNKVINDISLQYMIFLRLFLEVYKKSFDRPKGLIANSLSILNVTEYFFDFISFDLSLSYHLLSHLIYISPSLFYLPSSLNTQPRLTLFPHLLQPFNRIDLLMCPIHTTDTLTKSFTTSNATIIKAILQTIC